MIYSLNRQQERYVHGLEAEFNDRPQWQYSKIPQVFAPEDSKSRIKTWQIASRAELDLLLDDRDFAKGQGLQVSPPSIILRQIR
jgi:pyruvate decarboxylase